MLECLAYNVYSESCKHEVNLFLLALLFGAIIFILMRLNQKRGD
jgi:flagellar biogenesis protein FliO